ncbi:hypothetical protein LOK49_LG06G03400 [Camellia lanceoleosa]|uniref:Uncharacterized protein n=1 Tax=Camellia lanceoleosa TaxID=1840588 RepID=A0ACC0HHK5_9ERIC|nr:hypothetical protein LOK49_LG06G03400 [Camellia lanceoleosa]
MRRSTTVEGSESESTGNFVDIRRRGGNTGIKMGTSTALEEDPQAPPQMSNYHTKVTHPNAAPENRRCRWWDWGLKQRGCSIGLLQSRESSMSMVGLGIEAKRLFHLVDKMVVAANLVGNLERM